MQKGYSWPFPFDKLRARGGVIVRFCGVFEGWGGGTFIECIVFERVCVVFENRRQNSGVRRIGMRNKKRLLTRLKSE